MNSTNYLISATLVGAAGGSMYTYLTSGKKTEPSKTSASTYEVATRILKNALVGAGFAAGTAFLYQQYTQYNAVNAVKDVVALLQSLGTSKSNVEEASAAASSVKKFLESVSDDSPTVESQGALLATDSGTVPVTENQAVVSA